MRRLIVLILFMLILCFDGGCLDDIEEVSLEIPAQDISIPKGLTAQVDDGKVSLSWSTLEEAAGYRVYRSVVAQPRRIAETADTFYIDTDVRNGQVYYYSISALGSHGLEGKRSEGVEAVPTPYSVMINGAYKYTGSKTVTLEITAPATTVVMKIANDCALSGALWESFARSRSWNLEDCDGVKTVYAVFRDENGSISPVVADSIILDTYARIEDISFTPEPHLYSPGSTVHFTMCVEDSEIGGDAWIRVQGLSDAVALYDDGNGGDAFPANGVYETDFRFSVSVRGLDLAVSGQFIDCAGNEAPVFESEENISFTDPPESVQLIGVDDSTTSSITIRWAASTEENFTHYRIYRATTLSGIEEEIDSEFPDPLYLVRVLENIAQTTYPDGGLKEAMKYYYRVFVVNDLREAAGSNSISAHTYDAYPDPVVLDTLTAVGVDRVTLTWSADQSTDFGKYCIYRSLEPGVTAEAATLVDSIMVQEITFLDDTGLDLLSNDYYYKVYVFDKGAKSSRSNEVTTAH